MQQVFGRGVVPIQLPIGWEKGFRGVVDLITMKALIYTPDGNGIAKIEEIPQALADEAKLAHETLVEMVAEGNDELMQEFFDQGTLPVARSGDGLARSRAAPKRLFPVMLSSALHNIGSDALLNLMVAIFPSPAARGKIGATRPPTTRAKRSNAEHRSDSEPLSVFVFKTLADPFAGRINYFKVMSGVLKNDATLTNFNRGSQERFQHMQVMQGKTADGGERAARGRYRLDRQTERDHDRRNAGRQERADLLSAGADSRAFDHVCGGTEDARG